MKMCCLLKIKLRCLKKKERERESKLRIGKLRTEKQQWARLDPSWACSCLEFYGYSNSGFIWSVYCVHLSLAEINVRLKGNTPRRQAAKASEFQSRRPWSGTLHKTTWSLALAEDGGTQRVGGLEMCLENCMLHMKGTVVPGGSEHHVTLEDQGT